MIMLVLLTLFVIAAVNMSTINLRVMGNTQARNEAIGAAQQAIEQVVTTDFPKNPRPVTITVDVNGDGTSDYSVAIAMPACLNSIPIKVTELDAADVVNDGPCFGSIASAPRRESSAAAASAAAAIPTVRIRNGTCRRRWPTTPARTPRWSVHQGLARRVATGEVSC